MNERTTIIPTNIKSIIYNQQVEEQGYDGDEPVIDPYNEITTIKTKFFAIGNLKKVIDNDNSITVFNNQDKSINIDKDNLEYVLLNDNENTNELEKLNIENDINIINVFHGLYSKQVYNTQNELLDTIKYTPQELNPSISLKSTNIKMIDDYNEVLDDLGEIRDVPVVIDKDNNEYFFNNYKE